MCTGCFSVGTAFVIQGSAGIALAGGGLSRLRERLAGGDPLARRRAAHQANAEFLAGLGLDPDQVLGPPPPDAQPGSGGR